MKSILEVPLDGNGLQHKVGHHLVVSQAAASDRRGGVLLQPLLQSTPLICVPISSRHGLLHDSLQTIPSPELHVKHLMDLLYTR